MELRKIKQLKFLEYFIGASLVLSVLIFFIWKIPLVKTLAVIFGLFYVMFLPGYVAVKCFFKGDELDWVEKTGLSIGLSIALVVIVVIFTNYFLKIPVTALTNFLVILFLMGIMIGVKTLFFLKKPR